MIKYELEDIVMILDKPNENPSNSKRDNKGGNGLPQKCKCTTSLTESLEGNETRTITHRCC